jgi:tetratricopeptide (TPR) repeat protein
LPNDQKKLELQLELHMDLGDAEVKAGGLQDALRTYNQAARLARLAASDIDLARAAIGFEEGEFYLGQAEDASIVLLEEAMTALGGSATVERCRVLGGLGRAYSTVGAVERAREVTADAVEMARRLGDKRALYESLIYEYYTTAAGQTENARRALMELNTLAKEIGDWDLIMRAESWRGFHFLQAGDRDQYDESLRVYRTNAESHQMAIHIWVTTSANAMDGVLNGDFKVSERYAEEAFSLGQKMHMESAHGVYGTQMFTIRREQGRLAEIAPVFKKFVDEKPDKSTWRPGLALIASDLGFLEPARKVFDQMAEDEFNLAHDAKRSVTLSYLAEVCARLQDRKRAESLYKILQPYADLTITMGLTTICYGAAARFLGLLSATFEDWETAAGHFEVSIAKNSELRAWPWLAHSQADYAAMLRMRDDRSDAARIEDLLDSASSAAAQYDMVMLQGRVAALR